MYRFFYRRFLAPVLSMAIAISLIIVTFSLLSVVLFHSDSFIESGLSRNNDLIIEAANEELEKAADKLSVPSELLTTALTKENANVISAEVAHNFIYGYVTSLSNSSDLYSVFVNHITNEAPNYNLKLTDVQISNIASFAVDSVNEVVGNSDTASVRAFRFSRSKRMIVILAACIVIFIASVVALDLINSGIHRKYNYIGMGLVTAGAVMVASSLAIQLKGFLSAYHFCSFEAYNKAIQYCMTTLFNIFLFVGVVAFAIGFAMLVSTYRYFRMKKLVHMATKLNNDDKLTDYMDNYYSGNTSTHVPGEEFEKDVKKIDFD